MLLQLLILSWIVTLLSANSAPVFVVQPVSINTTDGREVMFTCTASDSYSILYFVDDDPVTDAHVIDKGFMQISESLGGGLRRRANLTVTASSSLDNTTIRCRADGSPPMNSDEVILRVQGPLSSVIDLSYSFITCYIVNISWSPPFTLPGTDITGYNVSATSNGTTTNYFTSNSYYELSLTDPFNEIMVNISGYNGLDGEVTTLDTIIPPARNLSLPLDVIIDHTLNVSLNFTATGGICSYEYPTSLEYRLFHDNLLFSNNTLSYADVVYSPLDIIRDQVYTIIVSFSNGLASELYQYNIVNTTFDTYDLVSVHVLNSSDSRVCLECSFSSFSTDNAGCTVELVSSTNSTLIYTQSFSKPNANSNIVEGCIYGISPGQYNITVYGGNRPPVLELTGTLIENTITSTTTTTTPGITVNNTSPIPSTDTKATNPSGRSSKTFIYIIVAAIAVVLALIALIVGIVIYVVYRKKRRKEIKKNEPSTVLPPPSNKESPSKEKA